MPGCFIAFEGIDGSGKSTIARIVAGRLRELGHDVVLTREPGGTAAGQKIRAVLLDGQFELSAEAELLLMCADRAEHVARVIRPALDAGSIVISDRYEGSTRAYQGYGLGLDLALVDEVISFATCGLLPDLTVLIDVDTTIAAERRSRDDTNVNALDLRDIGSRQRVRDGFLSIAATEPSWRVIDGSRAIDEVVSDAFDLVTQSIATRLTIR
jgi:dTMP kinase